MQSTPFGDELGEFSSKGSKDARGQPLFLARTEYRITTRPGKLYFIFFGSQRSPFTLPAMQNTIRRAYRLADGAAFEVKDGQLTTTGLMNTDPMATVIVVEFEGDRLRR